MNNLLYICCTTCNRQLQEKIFDSTFFPNLVIMLSAFIILGIMVGVLSYLSARKYRTSIEAYPNNKFLNPVPISTASIVLGIGLGGFIDGIFFHQILQWHQMLSNKLPPLTLLNKSVNMFWDGIFHLFSLIVVIIGVVLFWKLLKRKNIDTSGKLLAGGLIAGWGLFNIVEGVIDHHLLKLHNVKEITAHPEVWNYSFLVVSFVMIVAGYRMIISEGTKSINLSSKNTIFG